jgi:hypothetical protein
MKKLLTILLVLNLSAHGQVADSLTVIEELKGGTFNIDTLSVPVNSMSGFELSLTGFSTTNKVKCIKNVWISNTNGTLKIENNLTRTAWTGLTGGSFTVTLINNLVVLKIISPLVLRWKLKEFNL